MTAAVSFPVDSALGAQPLGSSPTLADTPALGDPQIGQQIAGLSQPLDLNAMDLKIQRMHTVDATWDLPPIPNAVKLDLATQQGTDHQGLTDFLYGLWHDATNAVAPLNPLSAAPAGAAPVRQTDVPTTVAPAGDQPTLSASFDSNPNSPMNQLRTDWAGIAGLKAPRVVDPGAVQSIKEQAIQRGLLPDPGPNGTVDGTWSPQIRSIQVQMANQDFSSRLAGNRPGAVSVNGLAGAMTKWLTPTGLLHGAMALDLLPNPGKIAHDWSTWGDKWRNFTAHPSAGGLWSALTGPILDVVTPVVNDFLLASGVSEAVMFARGAELAAGAVDAESAMSGLYRAASTFRDSGLGRIGGLGRGYDVAGEAAKFAEPSFLSGKVGQLGSVGSKVSDGMDAWRNWGAVQQAKKAVQIGMKLGVASNLEHLLPNSDGGVTASSLTRSTPLAEYFQHVATNPLTHGLQGLMDLGVGFVPPTVYGEGAVTGLAKSMYGTAFQKIAATSTSDQAVATIAQALHTGMTADIQAGKITDPVILDHYKRVTDAFTHDGPSAALLEMHHGDPQAMADYIHRQIVLTGTTHVGVEKAIRSVPDLAQSDPAKFRQDSQFFRNKATAQLSDIQPEDTVAYANARAFGEAQKPAQRLKLAQTYLDQAQVDPAEAQAWITNHQLHRNAFFQDLLDNHVTPAGLQKTVAEGMPHLMNEDAFTNASHEVQLALGDGTLGAGTRIAPAKSQLGQSLVDDKTLLASMNGPRSIGGLRTEPGSNLQLQLAPPRADDISKAAVNPLATAIDPSTTMFTVARKGEPRAQDALSLAHWSKQLLDQRAVAQRLEGATGQGILKDFIGPLQAKAADSGQALHDIRWNVLNGWIKELGTAAKVQPGSAKDFANLARFASSNGVDMGQIGTALDSDIAAISAHSIWSDGFGIGRNLSVDAGQPLLAAQLREARKVAPWLAARVDMTTSPELQALGARLDSQGYELVHGVQFVTPNHVRDLPGSFQDVTAKTIHRITLGNFFGRQDGEALRALHARTIRSELAGQLTLAASRGHFVTASGEPITNALNPNSPELEQVITALHGESQRLAGVQSDSVAAAHGPLSKLMANAQSVPYSFTDMKPSQTMKAIKPLWGDQLSPYIDTAFRNTRAAGGYRTQGLVAVERNLRAHDNFAGALQVLGRTPIGQTIRDVGAAQTPLRKVAAVGRGALRVGVSPTSWVGASVGANVASSQSPNDPAAAVLGGVAGALGGTAIATPLAKYLQGAESTALANHPTWSRYTHLADGLANLRDQLRFHLNPFFDLRRYTKGYALAQMHDLPEGVNLPINLSMKGFVRQYGEEAAGKMRSQFTQIARGQYGGFNPDALDETAKEFSKEGIMGFNPMEHMTSMFGHLVQQGADPERAFKIAKEVYQYGTTGRSAAEQSVNFIFFPFSFEKKVAMSAGKFLGSDLSRAAMLHDGLKAYDMLNQRYDLSNYWKEHLPVLQELEKVNAFAHGLSPGELGGINRPLLDGALAALGKGAEHSAILNMFIPQGVNINTKSSGKTLTELIKRTLPVRNDMGRLLDNLKQEGHVVFSPSHMTEQAETDHGWTEANRLKDQVNQQAIAAGGRGIASVMGASPGGALYGMKQQYLLDRLRLSQKFPAWQKSLDKAIATHVTDSAELNMRMVAKDENIMKGLPTNPGDQALSTFYNIDKNMRRTLKNHQIDLDANPEAVPSDIFQTMRSAAVQLVHEDPAFLADYNRFFCKGLRAHRAQPMSEDQLTDQERK